MRMLQEIGRAPHADPRAAPPSEAVARSSHSRF